MHRFSAKKDGLFSAILLGIPLVAGVSFLFSLIRFGLSAQAWSNDTILSFTVAGLILLIMGGFFLKVYQSTYYELDEQVLTCHSGFFKKRIQRDSIQWIKSNSYPSSGTRIALAWKGLLIGYGTGYILFIAPEDEALFLEKIGQVRF